METEVARAEVVLICGGFREAADEGAERGEDEDGGAGGTRWRKLGVFFALAGGEGRFWMTDFFHVTQMKE